MSTPAHHTTTRAERELYYYLYRYHREDNHKIRARLRRRIVQLHRERAAAQTGA
ncbi:hypothetical protein C8F04DRAFT_1261350 [Mycena alexandri]|uniref:Uncharacterized protein n=1 Tax=Mycena alexandri TaxID=1745969 RepID=A0AAD6X5M1_9AGAR|nr:hypothetical protein C8F04DRAFT_1261350 [Mycena alexandri]